MAATARRTAARAARRSAAPAARPADPTPVPPRRVQDAGPGRRRAAAPRAVRLGALLGAPLGLLLLVVGAAAPAHAQGYRYWSFWQREGGSWTYATEGPSTARPGDGDTVGFRFAVSEDSGDATRPRGTADFDTICADTPAKAGSKRVAIVLDFGTAADAPGDETPPRARTECARVDGSASAAEALAAVAKPLRYDSSAMLCGIAGYPATGCGELAEAGAGAKAERSGASKHASENRDEGPSAGLIGGVTAVVALGAAALWQARRRRA
ncbi:hypothetical protein LRS74_24210 [Streptomyces sp. LX-29]|uniref:SCO2322 family protein n=1 Tax=Streptomyces sp. LX-29 TaxID=2900152 RepID=UPI00240E3699|nr:SCO2322 family protein [Streptomyces sp. LX-29]WFB09804.1 hypothetical protein LRS74_24210 [Streptomyces sp. LX-29]